MKEKYMSRSVIDFLSKVSYSRAWLWKSCGCIILIGMMFAWGVDLLYGQIFDDSDVVSFDINTETSLYHVLLRHEKEGFSAFMSEAVIDTIALHDVSLMGLGARLYQTREADISRELFRRGAQGVEGAFFIIGLFEVHEGNYSDGFTLFMREYEISQDFVLRYTILNVALRGNLVTELDALRKFPEFDALMRGGFDLRQGIQQRDWGMILRNFWIAEYSNMRLSVLFLAALTGGIWGIIFLHIYPKGRMKSIRPYIGLSFLLGVISTWPTVWSGIFFDHFLGIREGNDFISTLLYHTMSVGFREELCKILLFIPMIPILRKKGGELDALLLGTMIGLGFATEENLNYFDEAMMGGVTFGRFVSANFLHCMLSGICGLAVYRIFSSPARWLSEGLLTITMAIVLHGFYNTLITIDVPGFGDLSYFSGTLLGIAAIIYFREVKARTPITMRKLSITGMFLWGFCILFNLDLITTTFMVPFRGALVLVGETALATVITGVLLFSQLQEPLTE